MSKFIRIMKYFCHRIFSYSDDIINSCFFFITSNALLGAFFHHVDYSVPNMTKKHISEMSYSSNHVHISSTIMIHLVDHKEIQ